MPVVHSLIVQVALIRKRLKINPYILVLISILLVLLIHWILRTFLEQSTLILFMMAVMISAWYGGWKPGFVATIVSLLLGGFFLADPRHTIKDLTISEIIRLGIFFIEGVLISLLSEAKNQYEKERDLFYKSEKKSYTAAQKAIYLRDQFISLASHELKSPITSQKAFVQIIRRIAVDNKQEKIVNLLDKVEVQINRIVDLINDLLDVSKIQAGKFEYNFSTFSIYDCIKEVVEQVQSISQHIIRVHGTIKRKIHADKDKISQVIINLLTNAIKYSPNNKEVIITLYEHKKNIEISVQDYGIGIDKKDQKNIFKKFFRVSSKERQQFSGMGIGLYIASEIIKNHKGKIWVKSRKGKGSIFSVILPYQQP